MRIRNVDYNYNSLTDTAEANIYIEDVFRRDIYELDSLVGLEVDLALSGRRRDISKYVKYNRSICIGFLPRQVIFNPPVTIVYWNDGTKTVVKCREEEFDEEKAVAMAIVRKAIPNRSEIKRIIKNASRPQEKHALK